MRGLGLDIIRAFVRSATSDLHVHPEPRPLTVALSRDYGSGGEEIARQLARVLGVRCLDGELLDAIAAETRGDKDALKRVDERVRGVVDQWLYNFFTQQHAEDTAYQIHLIHVLLDIPDHGGGVVVGRGASLILPRGKAFRARITGSLGVCAGRVQRDEGLSHFQAVEKIRRINAERAEFIRSRFGHDPADVSIFDLVVNTDRLEPAQAMELILHGMNLAGFRLPANALALVPMPLRQADFSVAG